MEADEAAQIEAAIKASLEVKDEMASAPTGAQIPTEEEENEASDQLETFDSDSEDIDYSLSNNKHSSLNGDTKNTNGSRLLGSYLKSKITDDSVRLDSSNNLNNGQLSEDKSSGQNDNTDQEQWKKYLGPETDVESKLMLRLPDGSKDFINMPSTSKLMVSFFDLLFFEYKVIYLKFILNLYQLYVCRAHSLSVCV